MPSLECRISALPQSVRFLFAGGFAAGVNWLVRLPLSSVLPYAPAVFTATMIGMTVGFALYQRLVFPGSHRPFLLRLRDFVLVNLAASVVTVAVAVLSNQVLDLLLSQPVSEAGAHAFGIAAGAALNFVGHRVVTFGDARRPAAVANHPC